MIKMMSFEEYLIMLNKGKVTPSMMAKQMYEREFVIKQLREEIADLKEHYNNMFECHCNRVEVEKLQNNWNELKKWLEEKMSVYEHKEASNFYVVFEKMQELEQGKDE